jgi:hypothetical protein
MAAESRQPAIAEPVDGQADAPRTMHEAKYGIAAFGNWYFPRITYLFRLGYTG